MDPVKSSQRFRPLRFVRAAAIAVAVAVACVTLTDSPARGAAVDAGGAVLAAGGNVLDWLGGAGFACLIVILAALATDGAPAEKSRGERRAGAGASIARRRE